MRKKRTQKDNAMMFIEDYIGRCEYFEEKYINEPDKFKEYRGRKKAAKGLSPARALFFFLT